MFPFNGYHQDDDISRIRNLDPPKTLHLPSFLHPGKRRPLDPKNGSSISPPQKCVFGRDMRLVPSRVTTKTRTKSDHFSWLSPLSPSPIMTLHHCINWPRAVVTPRHPCPFGFATPGSYNLIISVGGWTNQPPGEKICSPKIGFILNQNVLGVEILIKDFWVAHDPRKLLAAGTSWGTGLGALKTILIMLSYILHAHVSMISISTFVIQTGNHVPRYSLNSAEI